MSAIGQVSTKLNGDTINLLCKLTQPNVKPKPAIIRKALAQFGAQGKKKADGTWIINGSFDSITEINNKLQELNEQASETTLDLKKNVTRNSKAANAESSQTGFETSLKSNVNEDMEEEVYFEESLSLKLEVTPETEQGKGACTTPRRSRRQPSCKRKNDFVYETVKKSKETVVSKLNPATSLEQFVDNGEADLDAYNDDALDVEHLKQTDNNSALMEVGLSDVEITSFNKPASAESDRKMLNDNAVDNASNPGNAKKNIKLGHSDDSGNVSDVRLSSKEIPKCTEKDTKASRSSNSSEEQSVTKQDTPLVNTTKGQTSKSNGKVKAGVKLYSFADFIAGRDPDSMPCKQSETTPLSQVDKQISKLSNTSDLDDLHWESCTVQVNNLETEQLSNSDISGLEDTVLQLNKETSEADKAKELIEDNDAETTLVLSNIDGSPSLRTMKRIVNIPKPDKGIYHCEHCCYEHKERNSIRSHYLRYHLPKQNKCEMCNKYFGVVSDLRKHMRIVHGSKVKCDLCGKTYSSEVTLAKHKVTHEEGYVKSTFPCYTCEKVFASQYYLLKHMKYEHDKVEKPKFVCDWCGAVFSQKGHMLEHTNMHTGKRPHECNVCGKKFMYSASLRVHKAIHKDERNHICSICKASFKTRQGMLMHSDMHKEHKFKCAYCGKTFWQKGGLIRHTRMHLGLKPYVCTICGNSFSDPSILRRHLLLKHKIPKDSLAEFMQIARIGSKKLCGGFTPENLENIHQLVLRGEAPKLPPAVGQEKHMVLLVSDQGGELNLQGENSQEDTVFEVHLEYPDEAVGSNLAAAVVKQINEGKSESDADSISQNSKPETAGGDTKPAMDDLEKHSVKEEVDDQNTTEKKEATTQLTIATPQGETLLLIQGAPHEIDLPKVLESLNLILHSDAPESSVIVEECEVSGKEQDGHVETERSVDQTPETSVTFIPQESDSQNKQVATIEVEVADKAGTIQETIYHVEKSEKCDEINDQKKGSSNDSVSQKP